MSQPTPFNRLYNYTDYQTVNPTKPLPASNLDAELNAIELTTDQVLTNLALLQRDDGKLANQLVTPESLSAATLAIISQGEYNPRGAWAATTVFAVGDLATYNAATYLCIVAHTSTASFANDNTAGYWLLIANGALQGGGQAVDLYEGNASTRIFTLSYNYASSNAATVFVAGVAQIPVQDFTIVGTTLTFVTAPPAPSVAGRKNIMVRGTGIEAQLAADLATTQAANASGYAAAALTSKNAAATSATAAAASQTAAATSQTAAAGSASAASTSQTAAAASASAASTSQTAAATSATNAATSATTASTAATTATTQATNASTSATSASTSATTATTQATSAAASATTATTKAADATTAANNAATSATNAGSSSTSASSSATTATNAATTATNAASTATTQASNASSSATSANTSATNAATSATSASTSATAAASSAAAALTSKNNAATSETNAGASATAAAASATSAATSLDAFKKNYQGASASAPTTRYDGSALQVGDLYFNTTTNAMQVRSSSGWTNAGSSVNGTSRRFRYVASSNGQTTFSGADANSVTLAYDAGFIDVFLNGAFLDSTEYTATSGTSVVLAAGAAISDELNIVAYGTFQVANLNGADLQAGTVTGSKLAAATITSDKIADGAVITQDLANNAVTPAKMANGGAEFASNNLLINGNFDVWQRNTTITDWGSFAYTADNVQIGYDGTPASGRTVSQQTFTPGQTDVTEGDPKFYLQYAFPSCGTPTNYLRFPVEGVRTLAGRQATFSFWARCTSGTMTIGASIAQEFGSGGSPSGGVYPSQTNYTVTTTWQKFVFTTTLASIAGKTIGTNNNDMIWPAIYCPTNAAGTIQLANLKLEAGGTATPFQRRPMQVERALCERFLKVYGGNSGNERIGSGFNYSTTQCRITVPLTSVMRATPTLSVSASSDWAVEWASSSAACNSVVLDQASPRIAAINFGVASGLASGQGAQIMANATTNARLYLSAEM